MITRRMITVKCTYNGDSVIMRFNEGALKDVEAYIQKCYLNPKLEAQVLDVIRSFINGK